MRKNKLRLYRLLPLAAMFLSAYLDLLNEYLDTPVGRILTFTRSVLCAFYFFALIIWHRDNRKEKMQ